MAYLRPWYSRASGRECSAAVTLNAKKQRVVYEEPSRDDGRKRKEVPMLWMEMLSARYKQSPEQRQQDFPKYECVTPSKKDTTRPLSLVPGFGPSSGPTRRPQRPQCVVIDLCDSSPEPHRSTLDRASSSSSQHPSNALGPPHTPSCVAMVTPLKRAGALPERGTKKARRSSLGAPSLASRMSMASATTGGNAHARHLRELDNLKPVLRVERAPCRVLPEPSAASCAQVLTKCPRYQCSANGVRVDPEPPLPLLPCGGVNKHRGLIAVVGQAGSGKSRLLKVLQQACGVKNEEIEFSTTDSITRKWPTWVQREEELCRGFLSDALLLKPFSVMTESEQRRVNLLYHIMQGLDNNKVIILDHFALMQSEQQARTMAVALHRFAHKYPEKAIFAVSSLSLLQWLGPDKLWYTRRNERRVSEREVKSARQGKDGRDFKFLLDVDATTEHRWPIEESEKFTTRLRRRGYPPPSKNYLMINDGSLDREDSDVRCRPFFAPSLFASSIDRHQTSRGCGVILGSGPGKRVSAGSEFKTCGTRVMWNTNYPVIANFAAHKEVKDDRTMLEVKKVLTALKISRKMARRRFSELSSSEQAKVEIARCLTSEPVCDNDTLVLDQFAFLAEVEDDDLTLPDITALRKIIDLGQWQSHQVVFINFPPSRVAKLGPNWVAQFGAPSTTLYTLKMAERDAHLDLPNTLMSSQEPSQEAGITLSPQDTSAPLYSCQSSHENSSVPSAIQKSATAQDTVHPLATTKENGVTWQMIRGARVVEISRPLVRMVVRMVKRDAAWESFAPYSHHPTKVPSGARVYVGFIDGEPAALAAFHKVTKDSTWKENRRVELPWFCGRECADVLVNEVEKVLR
eukprot:GEMP01008469.1.p1 GENE.GEMP01008469.1~~GEMP01008469.1.p1  ORF type:complete len:856 (+),score=202.26 GEMP01008469.1:122-2689(+)